MIRHVSFDFWHTLVRANPDFKYVRAAAIRHAYTEAASDAQIVAAFTTLGEQFNREGEQDIAYRTPLESLAVAIESLGLPIDSRLEVIRAEIDALFLQHPPTLAFQELGDVLAALRGQGYTLSITSNTTFTGGNVLRKMLQHAGLLQHFDFQLFSDEIKAAKPVSRIFETVFQEAQRINQQVQTKNNVLHIGDNPLADIQGAQNIGFQAILVDGPHELQAILTDVSKIISSPN